MKKPKKTPTCSTVSGDAKRLTKKLYAIANDNNQYLIEVDPMDGGLIVGPDYLALTFETIEGAEIYLEIYLPDSDFIIVEHQGNFKPVKQIWYHKFLPKILNIFNHAKLQF
ncbi:MAG: hypothetical protein VKL39_21725 [Leptolyngbyaceae bacterium]|nr:hypothetical protein [Leptolyngbyaceae bacterium]